MASLGAEIAAARLLAPWFGASTIVWANTIATVLVALSIGYALGGRLADRNPTMQGLVALGGAGRPRCSRWCRSSAARSCACRSRAFDELSGGLFIGSLLGVGVLIAVPVLLLGMVSPYAVRLKVDQVEDAGRVAGRLYAIGTIGSLTGTFLAALLLIPVVGTPPHLPAVRARSLALVAIPGLGRQLGARRRRRGRHRRADRGPGRHHEVRRPADGKVIWETRDRVPVRPRHRGDRRRAPARAQRGPGRALDLPARTSG